MLCKVPKRPDYPYDEIEGFTKIGEIEWDNESYAFNITGLWTRDSDGTLWMAHDQGCSCPTPWESFDELERVFTVDQIRELRREHADSYSGDRVILSDWENFVTTATEALEGLK